MVRKDGEPPDCCGGPDRGGSSWRGGSQMIHLWVPRTWKRSQCGQKYQCVRCDISGLFHQGWDPPPELAASSAQLLVRKDDGAALFSTC
jgi:hypothetical protein